MNDQLIHTCRSRHSRALSIGRDCRCVGPFHACLSGLTVTVFLSFRPRQIVLSTTDTHALMISILCALLLRSVRCAPCIVVVI
ncbi:hypothetical protein ARMGADRAFT_572777 [Armillaria gallica]|uniref:Uncharacterized protein n=1 Tax=Armillaria gallica TaxID=47427 RepID=A0A2H3E3I7_ARMGA|nr:hypothetical protein ARMGADRAFT_572777 [Armillaria gallica]